MCVWHGHMNYWNYMNHNCLSSIKQRRVPSRDAGGMKVDGVGGAPAHGLPLTHGRALPPPLPAQIPDRGPMKTLRNWCPQGNRSTKEKDWELVTLTWLDSFFMNWFWSQKSHAGLESGIALWRDDTFIKGQAYEIFCGNSMTEMIRFTLS